MNSVSYTDNQFLPLSERENQLAKIVINIAFDLHKTLDPVLLKSVYEKCFCYELWQRNISLLRQQLVLVYYKELFIDDGLRLDILVDDLLIIELKSQENNYPVWEAQLLSYLKLTQKRISYIINFHTPLMKNGFKRLIYKKNVVPHSASCLCGSKKFSVNLRVAVSLW